MKRAIVIFVTLVVIFVGLLSRQLETFQAGSGIASYPPDTTDTGYEYYDGEGLDDGGLEMTSSMKKSKKMIEVDTKEDSVSVLVNRKYRLSEDYIPADLVVPAVRFSFYGVYEKSYVRKMTADALEKLFAAAEQKGVILKVVSGYRSYARQMSIYNRNVADRGTEKTDLVSAKPGSSEHQTGLAIDVSSESVGCAIEESFGDTTDGKWLAKHCHKYGFIIRYPKDKTEITGYSYEPWHIRYVGKNLATYLYKNNLTLEEYYQTTTVDEQIKNPEGKIHDVAEDEDKDEPQMTTAPTPNPSHHVTTTRQVGTSSQYTQATRSSETTNRSTATAKPKLTKKPKPAETQKSVVTEEDPEEESEEPSGTSSGDAQEQTKQPSADTSGNDAQESTTAGGAQDTTTSVETTEETTEISLEDE